MKTMYDIFTGGYGEFEKEGKNLIIILKIK